MADQIQHLGKYKIHGEIGKGGFATVYHATDTKLGRDVALKILDPLLMREETWVARFRREAKAISQLSHPNIVTMYEIGEDSGRLFIAMRHLQRGSLDKYIAQNAPLSWDEALKIATQISQAIDFAHSNNILHRDLKPSNILLDDQGNAILTDFGFAKLMGESSYSMTLSVTGGVFGTPQYLAPEIWSGQEASQEADIYAFGCVFYELITGQKLFEGSTAPSIMRAHFTPPKWPDHRSRDKSD